MFTGCYLEWRRKVANYRARGKQRIGEVEEIVASLEDPEEE